MSPCSILQLGSLEIHLHQQLVWRNGRCTVLTPTECAVLALLVEHLDQAVSADEILERVWPTGDPANVRVAIQRLRRKLEPNPKRPRYLHTLPGRGYCLVQPRKQQLRHR